MRDAGQIVVDSGQVRVAPGVADLETSITPDTVQRVITSRLDQLPPGEAMTMKVASVIGPRFALRTLTEIYPLPTEASTLLGHLDTLSRLDLVAPSPSAAEPTWEFGHVITQEVAYNLMLASQSQRAPPQPGGVVRADVRGGPLSLPRVPGASLEEGWRPVPRDRSPRAGRGAGAADLRQRGNDRRSRGGVVPRGTGRAGDRLLEAGSVAPPARRRLREHVALSRGPGAPRGRACGSWSARRHRRDQGRPRRSCGPCCASSSGERASCGAAASLSSAEEDEFVAVCRGYERLAEASYYSRETLLPLYCVIRILNEAEASGIPAEIARGFAGTGALFGVVPLPRVAEWYLRRALERSERGGRSDDPRDRRDRRRLL